MKMSLKAILVFVCLMTANWLFAQPAETAAAQEVVVKGMGAIIGGDEAKARDDAIANALRNAVEQVIGTMIESDVIVQNYQVLEDQIYSHTRGYVQSYEVISSNKQGDTILEVTIRALVKKGDLKNNLEAIGLIMSRKGKPRLMLLIEEKNMGTAYYSWAADLSTTETVLMEKMMEKGFRFVDKQTVMRKLKRNQLQAALNGDVMVAQQIAQQTGAEVLLIGKALSKPASGGPRVLQQAGMVSCQANINLRAVRADDGSILATASQQAAAAHIDQITGGTLALKKAANFIADDLAGKIVEKWQQDVYSGTTINLRLLDVPTFSDLVKFKNLLPVVVRGVQNLYQRDFSAGTAEFELDVKGSANQIAEEMAVKDFSPYKVEVLNVSQNTIVAKLIK